MEHEKTREGFQVTCLQGGDMKGAMLAFVWPQRNKSSSNPIDAKQASAASLSLLHSAIGPGARIR